MGLLALLAVYPHRLKKVTGKQELTFAAAGMCGICLYYLLENIALTYTMASNVGVIISVAPFFTAIFTHLFMKGEEKLRVNFFLGFAVATVGIFLISFNGSKLTFNPMGDLLALLAALAWACYSVLTNSCLTLSWNLLDLVTLSICSIFFIWDLGLLPFVSLRGILQ